MADRRNPQEPLGPLRARDSQDPGDKLMAAAFDELYTDSPHSPASPADWAKLEPMVARVSGRRRRRHLLRELAATVRPRWLATVATAAACLIAGAWLGLRATAVPPRLALEAKDGSSRAIALSNGASVELTGEAEVDQVEPSRTRIALRTGLVRVAVPHLPVGNTLMVLTEGAEVVVHGTRFTVEAEKSASTRVSVAEGLVEVRPLGGARPVVFLRPGESVTIPSFAAYFAELSTRASEVVAATRCDDESTLRAYVVSAPVGVDVSAALYLEGFCAVQRGDSATAVARFETVVRTTTELTRADNALARLAQLAEGSGADSAAKAWRRYLDRFPQGLHRSMAQAFFAPRPGAAR